LLFARSIIKVFEIYDKNHPFLSPECIKQISWNGKTFNEWRRRNGGRTCFQFWRRETPRNIKHKINFNNHKQSSSDIYQINLIWVYASTRQRLILKVIKRVRSPSRESWKIIQNNIKKVSLSLFSIGSDRRKWYDTSNKSFFWKLRYCKSQKCEFGQINL
jgi:hypothetical protein